MPGLNINFKRKTFFYYYFYLGLIRLWNNRAQNGRKAQTHPANVSGSFIINQKETRKGM